MTCRINAELVLSTEHPRSSYGVPVLEHAGTAYGPRDALPAAACVGTEPMTAAELVSRVEFDDLGALRFSADEVELARRFCAADPTGPQVN